MERARQGFTSWLVAAVWALAAVVHVVEGDLVVAAGFLVAAVAVAVVRLAEERPRIRSIAHRAATAALLCAVVGLTAGLVRDLA